jgi:tetratricopeptide (TPR) repeat protein
MEKALELKTQANGEFTAGNIQQAVALFHQALLYAKGLDANISSVVGMGEASEQERSIKTFLSTLYSNLAACHVKLQRWDRAIVACNEALKHDNGNIKAKFRLSQAYLSSGDVDRAQTLLDELQKEQPNDAAVRNAMVQLKQKKKAQDDKQASELRGFLTKK